MFNFVVKTNCWDKFFSYAYGILLAVRESFRIHGRSVFRVVISRTFWQPELVIGKQFKIIIIIIIITIIIITILIIIIIIIIMIIIFYVQGI